MSFTRDLGRAPPWAGNWLLYKQPVSLVILSVGFASVIRLIWFELNRHCQLLWRGRYVGWYCLVFCNTFRHSACHGNLLFFITWEKSVLRMELAKILSTKLFKLLVYRYLFQKITSIFIYSSQMIGPNQIICPWLCNYYISPFPSDRKKWWKQKYSSLPSTLTECPRSTTLTSLRRSCLSSRIKVHCSHQSLCSFFLTRFLHVSVEFLVEAICLSVDPYMRPYSKSQPTGQAMLGSQVARYGAILRIDHRSSSTSLYHCRVIKTRNGEYPLGTHLVGYWGWRTHTVVDPRIPPAFMRGAMFPMPDLGKHPRSLGLGAVGMPG